MGRSADLQKNADYSPVNIQALRRIIEKLIYCEVIVRPR